MVENNSEKVGKKKNGLGTFEGVYTPTVLTILGVVLYLRLGWVVGNVGLIGTVLIILLAHVITIATALSMSSMLTNIKIGPGGAYAIITRSLGHEMGGAIGIPLYISQTFSIAFYITGFSELWLSFFPSHSQMVVGIITWIVLSAISIKSAKLAFRIQYGILVAVGASLISFLLGPNLNQGTIVLNGAFVEGGFWMTFAIFFPAVTGVLTGATMSGELENPRASIIRGTLSAVFTGLIVYLFVAYWFAHQATQVMLLSDSSIILKLSKVQFLVVAGVMGAVISSALSTLVSAPRTLSALAEDRVVPFSSFFAKQNSNGEPVNAIVLSSIVSLVVIIAGSLDRLAELLTMFFLTTYGMINLVVFLEQVTGVISYRPSLKMTIFVPIIGSIGCLSVMLLINPIFTIITFMTIIFLYIYLKSKNLTSPLGDVRGGIFISIAEWAAQKAASIPNHPRLWKPSVVVPTETTDDFRRVSKLIDYLVYPSGRIYYLSSTTEGEFDSSQLKEINEVLKPLKESNLYVQETFITNSQFDQIIIPSLQCLKSSFLSPNIVFLTISEDLDRRSNVYQMVRRVRSIGLSSLSLWLHPKMGLGIEKKINLWLRDKSPNNDLTVLSALQLSRNMNAELNLCRVIYDEKDKKNTVKSMVAFIEDARLPANTKIRVFSGNFYEYFSQQSCDLCIVGMPVQEELANKLIELSPSSLLLVSSSGLEDALL